MTEPVFKGRGLCLQAMLVMDARFGAGNEITAEKVREFHPDDKNTMMITAIYYFKENMARMMLENGADLSARNAEACRIACTHAAKFPNDVKAIGILKMVSEYAESQDVNLAAIRKEVLDDIAKKKTGLDIDEPKETRMSSRRTRQEAAKKGQPFYL